MCGLVCLANVFDTEFPWKQTEHLFTRSLFGSFERVWEVCSLSAGETCGLRLAAITCDQVPEFALLSVFVWPARGGRVREATPPNHSETPIP